LSANEEKQITAVTTAFLVIVNLTSSVALLYSYEQGFKLLTSARSYQRRTCQIFFLGEPVKHRGSCMGLCIRFVCCHIFCERGLWSTWTSAEGTTL